MKEDNVEKRTDHTGKIHDSIKEMCKEWGVGYTIYMNRVYQYGWSKKRALTTKVEIVSKEDRTDHTGKIHNSIKEMCKEWGIDYKTYKNRVYQYGWSKKRALTTKVVTVSKEDRTDHTGKTYVSIVAMCKEWGIEAYTYRNRIKHGWSKERALATVVLVEPKEARTDHTGKTHESLQEMCEEWGVKVDAYRNRIKYGWSKERALITKVVNMQQEIESRTDHTGKIHDRIEDMCREWKIKSSIYHNRVNQLGWSKEKALTTRSRSEIKEEEGRTDHTGIIYDSIKQMCEYWRIDNAEYERRVSAGWSKERALTTEVDTIGNNREEKEVIAIEDMTDHTGKVFCTIVSMCETWGIKYGAYRSRINAGWDKDEALGCRGRGLEARIREGEQISDKLNIIDKAYTGIDGAVYYDVELEDGKTDIMNADEIMRYGKV